MAFEITINSTTSPVGEGGNLDVDYTVENTGTSQETQTVELLIDPTLVEGVEHNNLTGNYTNSTGAFAITSSPTNGPTEGTYALIRDGDLNSSGSRVVYLADSPTDVDESILPEAGNDFAFDIVFTETADSVADFFFFHNGDKNASITDESHYSAWLNVGGGTFVLRAVDSSGSATNLDAAGVTYSANETYTVEIRTPEDPTSNPITLDLIDSGGSTVASLSGTDTHTASGWTSGDFAWRGGVQSAGEQITFDNLRYL